jgi:hypothetical protein
MRVFSALSSVALVASTVAAQLRTLPIGYRDRPGEYMSGSGVEYPFARAVAFHSAPRYSTVLTAATGSGPHAAGAVITAYPCGRA